ncbi:hypothetical protein LSAT2_028448 [Lamellibrachia satsuma]|nr:hypothetical protein LSAT2_028448 [Lamellibrachia satsuma]
MRLISQFRISTDKECHKASDSTAKDFQSDIQTTLHGIQKTINISDDTLVHGCTQAEHNDSLSHVVERVKAKSSRSTEKSDILMSCFVSVRIIANLQIEIWSATDCRVYAIVRYLPLYLGINSIMLIAVERFVAIVLPTRFRAFVAPGMVKLQLTFVWLLTFVELIFPWYYIKKVFEFDGLHSCTVYYNPYHYLYMSLTAIILPAVLLLTLYGSIVGVVVHRQRKVNASIALDTAGGVASVQSTMNKEQAAGSQRVAILVYFIADDRFRSVFLRLVCRKETDVGVSVQTPSSVNETTT